MTPFEAQERRWEAEINRRTGQGDGLEFTLAHFAKSVGADANDPALISFFNNLVRSTAARRIEACRCPLCASVLPADTVETLASCPYCQADFQQEGVEIIVDYFYRLEGANSRDIRWVIVIHGMNSRAPWQEEFSWQIANRLRYSAPVLIYKYGWATIDVLITPLHRRLARRLGDRIRIAIKQATGSERPSKPDIIAHSFGTRLFSLILEDPDFQDLEFGRVITAGSIVRPDFDWSSHIESGRVEAVMNHVGGKDSAVPLAHYTIPGAGPGGKVGYASMSTLNVSNPQFGHSDFFVPQNLRTQIAEGGLWYDFLTRPLAHFRPHGAFVPALKWQPACWPVRALIRTLLYAVFCVAGPLSWLRRKIDP
ncbi:hypothetical protein [Pseudomonas veronii]|uniref:hypothetical protein n=1 Tax=Pseudomonas veronii TaxID=76761 RepID=UPI002658316E|nr:hypothetical protein [Pseudomonas veronii]WKC47349.1 hypothetical protein QYP03_02610 [Pseudomonas veronii]